MLSMLEYVRSVYIPHCGRNTALYTFIRHYRLPSVRYMQRDFCCRTMFDGSHTF